MPRPLQRSTSDPAHEPPFLQVVADAPDVPEPPGGRASAVTPTVKETIAHGVAEPGALPERGFLTIDYDPALVDVDRLEELELMVQLMATATEAPARVPLHVIDRVLGVDPDPREPVAPSRT